MSRERPLLTPVCYVDERKQFVESIPMVSNEYGPNLSYSSINLIGRPSNFPIYGDHTDSYLLVGVPLPPIGRQETTTKPKC